MFFTFVLFMAPQASFPILAPLYLAKLSAGLALAVYVLDRLSHARPLTVGGPAVRLVLCLLALATFSIPFSLWPGGSLDLLRDEFLKSILIFILIANTVNTTRRMKIMIGSMTLWCVIIAWTGIQEYLAGNFYSGHRIFGYASPLAANPNDLALTMNMVLPLVIGLYFAARKGLPRAFLLAAIGCMAGAVIASFSRGGFLTIMAILIALIINHLKERGPATLIWTCVGLALLLVLLPAGYSDRVYSIFDFKADPTGSADARWDSMVLAWNTMLAHPVLGVGLGMHGLDFLHQLGNWHWSGVHNVYLQIGADLGVPGLLVYLLTLWYLFNGNRQSLKHIRQSPEARELLELGNGIQVALVGFLVGAFFAPVAYEFYFFYIAGFAVAFQEMVKRSHASFAAEASIAGLPEHASQS